MTENDIDIVRGWCLEQLAPWLSRDVDTHDIVAERERLNRDSLNIFLVTIRERQVLVADKPPSIVLPEIVIGRISAYRAFFLDVIRSQQLDIETTFVLNIGDGGPDNEIVPIFMFQKPLGSKAVLIPDVDFFTTDFYERDEYVDGRAYSEKATSAIFVGSTTGAHYTQEAVRTLSPPRLRAAMYFRDKADVAFLLPNLAQCDSTETEELLRSMGFGSGEFVRWRQQIRNKFVISMDGNGATCSRVVAALKSNSALVRYASPHVLYYFSQIIPWTHYIPVTADADIEGIVALERGGPGLFEHVARQGRIFAERFLHRSAVYHYTAQLLRLYAASERRGVSPGYDGKHRWGAEDTAGGIRAECLVHLQDHGDVWVGNDGWAGRPSSGLQIEGFLLLPLPTESPQEIAYQTVGADAVESAWASAGEFSGTAGKSLPIVGIRIRLSGACAERFEVIYSATFVDGSRCGPCRGGELCSALALSPMEAIMVTLSRRPAAAASTGGGVPQN